MKRWVGLGVIADNVINLAAPWKKVTHVAQPQKMPLRKTAGHPAVLLCRTLLTLAPENINFAPESS